MKFLEVKTDKDHVHFLIQSVLKYGATQIVTKIKSIIIHEIFRRYSEVLWVRKFFWGGQMYSCRCYSDFRSSV
ncbi:MAG: transposase [Alphaproteobacteria bacterium]|nr:transposase [Alphaproteobacteria bacterium]